MKKRLLSFLLTVLMLMQCVSMVPFAASAEEYTGSGTFAQCTGALTSGYYVFGVGTSAASIAALNTDTSSNNWIKFTTTTSTSGSITNPDSSIVWYYDAEAGTFKNGTNYVAWPTTGNSAFLKTTGTPLTVTETATAGVYNITVTATPARMLRLNSTSGYRFYTTNTGTNPFYFFKLQEAKHEHAYAWDGNAGTDGSHTLVCAYTDGKCDALTITGECTWEGGYCSVCDAEAPECDHPNTTEVPEDPATCTEGGYTAGVQCTVCNQYISGHEEIEALKHNLVTDAAVPATCTETGLTKGSHCDREGCGYVETAQDVVPALGHNYVNGVCTNEGCGQAAPLSYTFDYTTGTNETAAADVTEGLITLDFDKGTHSTSVPKYYTSGSAVRLYKGNTLTVSTVAGYYIKSVTITLTQGETHLGVNSGTLTIVGDNGAPKSGIWTPANKETTSVTFNNAAEDTSQVRFNNIAIELGKACTHESTVGIGEPKDATCTEDGITAGKKCADCGEVITEQETIEATGHTDVNPADSKCDTCGTNLCTEHVWVDNDEPITAPTCTATGLTGQYCSVCGEPNPTERVMDKVAHTPETDVAVAPTCTATGLTEGSHCSVCTEVLTAQEEVPMIDHDYDGNKCTVCGDVKVTGTQIAEFQFGENGDAEHKDGSEDKLQKSYISGSYSLTWTEPSRVYGDAFDAKGNSALKLGTSSKAASFSFTVDNNVNTVVLYIAGYKTNAAKIEVNGTAYEVTSKSDEGDYTKIVVDTSTNKTVTLKTLSGGYRAMIDSIQFWGKEVDKVAGYTTTLGENIGVNFYMALTEATLADSSAYMHFTLPNGNTKDVYVNTVSPNNGVYKFTADIAVKEMAVGVKAELITAAGTTVETTYSVKEYAEYIINPTNNYTENEVKLAKAMLNYGAYAQVMFDYNTGNLANSELAEGDQALSDVTVEETYKKNVTENIAGATYAGTTTLWEANTSIRHYFTVTDENVTFKLNGQELPVQENGDYKYVTIDGIVAKDMETTYQLVVSNGTKEQTIDYSVYSYFYDILNGNYTEAEKNAIKAAYLYSQAALDYLAN